MEIIHGLKLKLSLDEEFTVIRKNFAAKAGKDYAASRGEYLNGIVMANYIGYEFIDAATVRLQVLMYTRTGRMYQVSLWLIQDLLRILRELQ